MKGGAFSAGPNLTGEPSDTPDTPDTPEPRESSEVPTPAAPTGRPLRSGNQVQLIDRKDRRYLVHLQAGSEFHSHAGVIRTTT